jgi:hypothetical protein
LIIDKSACFSTVISSHCKFKSKSKIIINFIFNNWLKYLLINYMFIIQNDIPGTYMKGKKSSPSSISSLVPYKPSLYLSPNVCTNNVWTTLSFPWQASMQ